LLELAILGFLREEPLHGYELKQRLAMLAGHFRRVSDGALYPAIARLERRGLLFRHQEPGEAAAPRQVLSLTSAGQEELLQRLRSPTDVDISDRNRFFTILAFLKYLQPHEQQAVLARRLAFLESGRSFFRAGGRPVSLADERDPFRKGMLHIARETSRVEQQWLRETIAALAASKGN
jgi:DNA-binding PadR family transcriptional regulator